MANQWTAPPWLSGKTDDTNCDFQSFREFESRRNLLCRLLEKQFCAVTLYGGLTYQKLTPWRPSKRCNPAIRRGVLKKSPTVLYGALSLGWALSEKQPAAPSMDELWNRICSGKHLAGELSRMGPVTLACAIISHAVVLLQLVHGTV